MPGNRPRARRGHQHRDGPVLALWEAIRYQRQAGRPSVAPGLKNPSADSSRSISTRDPISNDPRSLSHGAATLGPGTAVRKIDSPKTQVTPALPPFESAIPKAARIVALRPMLDRAYGILERRRDYAFGPSAIVPLFARAETAVVPALLAAGACGSRQRRQNRRAHHAAGRLRRW